MLLVKVDRWARVNIRHDLGYDVSHGDLGTLRHAVRYALMYRPEIVREVKYGEIQDQPAPQDRAG